MNMEKKWMNIQRAIGPGTEQDNLLKESRKVLEEMTESSFSFFSPPSLFLSFPHFLTSSIFEEKSSCSPDP